MKKTNGNRGWALVAVAAIVVGGQFLARGQQPVKAPDQKAETETRRVGLLDVSRVFKEHKGVREKLDTMKLDVTSAEDGLKKDRQKIAGLVEDLKSLQRGTPAYDALEREIGEAQLRLQLSVNNQKSDFMKREATIYADVYQDLEREVEKYARQHRMYLVLRFNGEPMDVADRQSVLTQVNRAVVYKDDEIDITNGILERLNTPVEGAF